MRSKLLLIAFTIVFGVNAQVSNMMKYPSTTKGNIVEQYGSLKVADPYRWLEDDNSAETKKWVVAQNNVTQKYLSSIPFKEDVRKRLEQLWNYPKYSTPFKKGGYYYYYLNEGLQNQAVLYRQKELEGTAEEFLNPNTINKEGIAALDGITFSKSGKYAAYAIGTAGSDWQEIFVIETGNKKAVGKRLEWVKFSGYSWNGDDGFYYSRYDKPDSSSRLSGQNQFHKLYYHKIGTEQADDQLIYQDKDHPLHLHNGFVTEDNRFLILITSVGTSGVELKYKDLKDSSMNEFKTLLPGFKDEAEIIDNDGDLLIMKTNVDAPNYKVVSIDPKHPEKEKWKTLISEKPEALHGVGSGGKFLFAQYLKDAATKVVQFAYDGTEVREIKLPGIGSADGFGGERQDKEFFYSYSSFNSPPAIYKYNIGLGTSDLYRSTKTAMNTADFVTEQIFFQSKDGTKVPVFLTYKKGMKKDGSNPVLLYGYGGFNIPMTPGFSIGNAFFIEQGGIYAVVNLRGGSEYGETWHKQGMMEKKQNVFDDFIGAAEYLIKEKYTNNQKIAARGGSNGGLLVGAAMTQRPDLFNVALPAVGVLDMLRFQKFTIGAAWITEYGSADNAEQFPYLYKYSPYHNLKPGVKYPATLITTGDHDDRVVPAHSFKFAARLQEYQSGVNPVLIRVETNAGHGAGKPTSKLIDEATDVWSFTMQQLGMKYKPVEEEKKAF